MNISDYLRELLDEADRIVKITAEKLENAPQGYLKVKKCGKAAKYYYQKSADCSEECFLAKDEQTLVRALEERDYCKKLQRVARKRETTLCRAEKLVAGLPSAEAVYFAIPAERRDLIEPIELGKEMTKEEVEAWNAVNKRKHPSVPSTYFVTKGGEKVRSKSEVIIAERLRAAGVPYQYETILQMCDEYFFDNYIWKPDFKVLNVKNGKSWYWEHFGMMDDPDYCAASLFKFESYAKFGIFPGKNLIFTAETRQHPLNIEYVDRVIEEYLLKG